MKPSQNSTPTSRFIKNAALNHTPICTPYSTRLRVRKLAFSRNRSTNSWRLNNAKRNAANTAAGSQIRVSTLIPCQANAKGGVTLTE